MYQMLNPVRSIHKLDKSDRTVGYCVSYGGGVNSTAMVIRLLEERFPIDKIIFSDTGDEMPETYAFIRMFSAWLEKRYGRSIITVQNRIDKTVTQRIKRYNYLPSHFQRWCTKEFKIQPIKREVLKLKKHSYQYVGIDYGEVHRMRESDVQYITLLYPLVDWKMNRDACVKYIEEAGLPAPGKSGCYFCFYQSPVRLKKLYDEHPDLWKKARELEENHSRYKKETWRRDGSLKMWEDRFRHMGDITKFFDDADKPSGECTGFSCPSEDGA